jgi:ribulose 1,5-bisphosphate carboxylase large subunit-like protein
LNQFRYLETKKHWAGALKFKSVTRNLPFPMMDLRPTIPMPSGWITLQNVQDIVNALGTDIMIGSGGGIRPCCGRRCHGRRFA